MAVATRPHLIDRLAKPRGRLTADAPLGPQTWFATGGPAEVLFRPADVEDLAAFLAALPADVPVTVMGVGSNVIVRDGGIRGVVIRLLRGFTGITVDGHEVVAGAGAPDLNVALTAREHSLAGLEFLSGIPGTIGGAFPTNAGAYGGELAEVLISAEAVDRAGRIFTVKPARARTFLPPQRCADRLDLHLGAAQGGAGRPARDRAAHQRDRRRARRLPAAQPHRRLDLRQSARPQGVGADRRRRLPWTESGRRPGLGEAHQFPDQHRRCHRFRHREAGRGSAPARVRQESACGSNGRSAASESSNRVARLRS